MTRLVRILLAVLVCSGAGLGGLFYLDRSVQAPVATVEKVLPNDSFPR